MKWLEEKRVQLGRQIGNFVQVFIGPQVAAIVHSKYLQVRSFYLHVHMYICTLSDSLAATCEFLRCHTLHSLPFVHDISCANTSQRDHVVKKLGRILVSHDTAKGVASETRSDPQWISPSRHVPGCTIDTKSQKGVFTCICGHQKRLLIVLCACVCAVWTLE